MDIGQFIFPFIMAVITNSIMILAIYFLRKIPYFSNLFSVWFMVVLYLVCVLRMFLPLEFPDVQVILRDDVLLNTMVNVLMVRTSETMGVPSVYLYVIFAVWVVGSLVFGIISVYIHATRKTYYLANFDFTSEDEKRIFDQICCEVLGSTKNIVLKKTDAVRYIMEIGYFKKYVLLPEKAYTENELEMIFRHECTHIKNKDLWLKLLVHIYCCIFWWNPFSYLLKHDLDFTLEMRCDLSATKNFSDEQKKGYFDTLMANCHRRSKKNKDEKNYFFICSELSDNRKNKEFVKRTAAIAKDAPNKVGQTIANALVSLLLVSVFIVSYFFIWQPFYGFDAKDEDYELAEDEIIMDENNSYLIRQEDGSYVLYYQDIPISSISEEEVEEGLYNGFPILDN